MFGWLASFPLPARLAGTSGLSGVRWGEAPAGRGALGYGSLRLPKRHYSPHPHNNSASNCGQGNATPDQVKMGCGQPEHVSEEHPQVASNIAPPLAGVDAGVSCEAREGAEAPAGTNLSTEMNPNNA